MRQSVTPALCATLQPSLNYGQVHDLLLERSVGYNEFTYWVEPYDSSFRTRLPINKSSGVVADAQPCGAAHHKYDGLGNRVSRTGIQFESTRTLGALPSDIYSEHDNRELSNGYNAATILG